MNKKVQKHQPNNRPFKRHTLAALRQCRISFRARPQQVFQQLTGPPNIRIAVECLQYIAEIIGYGLGQKFRLRSQAVDDWNLNDLRVICVSCV